MAANAKHLMPIVPKAPRHYGRAFLFPNRSRKKPVRFSSPPQI